MQAGPWLHCSNSVVIAPCGGLEEEHGSDEEQGDLQQLWQELCAQQVSQGWVEFLWEGVLNLVPMETGGGGGGHECFFFF